MHKSRATHRLEGCGCAATRCDWSVVYEVVATSTPPITPLEGSERPRSAGIRRSPRIVGSAWRRHIGRRTARNGWDLKACRIRKRASAPMERGSPSERGCGHYERPRPYRRTTGNRLGEPLAPRCHFYHGVERLLRRITALHRSPAIATGLRFRSFSGQRIRARDGSPFLSTRS